MSANPAARAENSSSNDDVSYFRKENKDMKYTLSARNQFEGVVSNVREGAVNGIVTLDVNGTPVSATISMAAIKELGLEKGVDAVAVIKATEIFLL